MNTVAQFEYYDIKKKKKKNIYANNTSMEFL